MEEHRLYIQTELCTSTLSAEIQQLSPVLLSAQRRYKFLREICLALEFIHKNGMVHLDIKPENIFVKNDQFKLGDFGLVSKVSSHDVEEGDSRYMSMELLSGDHADLTKSDIFSLGISLYEICLGAVRPLPANGPEWQSLRAAQFRPLANTPDSMQEIIKVMMHPNVTRRPTASELLKRPHLLSEEQKALLEEQKKVAEANLALAERSHQYQKLPPPLVSMEAVPPRPKALRRSNTWNGF
jgi:wee1-like protein kinase